jgi:hypothetical protein
LQHREFRVRLSSPTGGAVLGAAPSARVRLASVPVAPDPPPSAVGRAVRMTKRYAGAYVSGGRRHAVWDVHYEASGDAPLSYATLQDILPDGFYYSGSEWISGNAQCAGITGGFGAGPEWVCELSVQGRRDFVEAHFRVTATAYPSTTDGLFVNRCGALTYLEGREAPLSIDPSAGTCRAEARIDFGALQAACPMTAVTLERLPLDGIHSPRALSVFPAPNSITTNPVLPGHWYAEYVALPPDAPRRSGRLTVQRLPGQFSEAVSMSLSACPGDFPGTDGAHAQGAPPACRYDGPPFAMPGAAPPGISFRVGGEPASDTCVLEPGRLYYWNLVFANTADGLQAGENLCQTPTGCGVKLEW